MVRRLKRSSKIWGVVYEKVYFRAAFRIKERCEVLALLTKAWNFQNNIDSMPKSYLEEVLNSINKVIIECIGSASFRYCVKVPKEKEDLYTFINQELPKKSGSWSFQKIKRKLELR